MKYGVAMNIGYITIFHKLNIVVNISHFTAVFSAIRPLSVTTQRTEFPHASLSTVDIEDMIHLLTFLHNTLFYESFNQFISQKT